MAATRRLAIGAGLAALGAAAGAIGFRRWTSAQLATELVNVEGSEMRADGGQQPAGMQLRSFGKTGMQVSEVGFGAWAIGGKAYGAVSKQAAHDALSVAEELGCNFVDTAMVYWPQRG